MPTGIPRWGGALAALAMAAFMAACGTSTQATRTVTSTATETVTASSAASPTTSATAPQAGAATVPAGCTHPHTVVSLGQEGAATGHIGIAILFRNSGTAPCTLTGYPGLELVGSNRRLDAARTLRGFMGGLTPEARAVPGARLAPAGFASALLEGGDFNPKTNGSCPRYSALLVTPPNQRVAVHLPRSLAICDPEIHPVVAGTTGRQGG